MRERSRLRFALAGIGLGLLLVAACAPISAPAAPLPAAPMPTNSLQDIVWEWTEVIERTTGNVTTVPSPEDYTLVLRTDGTLSSRADCNTFTGAYSQENGFSIVLGATTLAACGEDSMDQQYLQLLSEVAAGGPDGAGSLALENAGGEKRMLFRDSGPTPE